MFSQHGWCFLNTGDVVDPAVRDEYIKNRGKSMSKKEEDEDDFFNKSEELDEEQRSKAKALKKNTPWCKVQ